MELRVGGKYKVMKRLGQGAFGEIYSGVNVKTNEEVAIKLVSPCACSNETCDSPCLFNIVRKAYKPASHNCTTRRRSIRYCRGTLASRPCTGSASRATTLC